MKNSLYLFLILSFMFPANHGFSQTYRQNPDKIKVEKVIKQFKQFWEDKDMNILPYIMDSDVQMISYETDGSEILIGWNTLKDSLKTVLQEIDHPKIRFSDPLIMFSSTGQSAWFNSRWDWDLNFDGQPSQFKNQRLTCLLEKRNGVWKIIKFHTSNSVNSNG